jgi:phage tail protein X
VVGLPPRRVVGALASAALCAGLGWTITASTSVEAQNATLEVDGCSGPATAVEGRRSLVLLVGASTFADPSIPRLAGPENDVRAMKALLVDGFGFPRENVCTLTGPRATKMAVERDFRRALIDRAQRDDVAVFYFSGHMSSRIVAPDLEEAGFVLHDSRKDGAPDLGKDTLDALLRDLYARTRNVVVILDSDVHGTRGARGVVPAGIRGTTPDASQDARPGARGAPPGRGPWLPDEMKEAVFLAAASEGARAFERDGHGVFTSAFVDVASQPTKTPITYAQAFPLVAARMSASTPQEPFFEGALDKPLFSARRTARPVGWVVASAGDPVVLSGPPAVGMGPGAELRVYRPGLAPAAYVDPSQAKATIVVSSVLESRVEARVITTGAQRIAVGDVAVLVRPSDQVILLALRLVPEGEVRGIPRERSARLERTLNDDPDARAAVRVVSGAAWDFELSMTPEGQLQLRDSLGQVRSTYVRDDLVPRSLWQHARQKALLLLRGEGGSDFTDNRTLEVTLRPAPEQRECGHVRVSAWTPARPNAEQVVPLCVSFRVHVKLSATSPKPLLVGGVLLSSDGTTIGFPRTGERFKLEPGAELDFPERFQGTPPVDVPDTVRVFGTQLDNPVDWASLTWAAANRGLQAIPGVFQAALERYISPGARQGALEPSGEQDTWTVSTLRVRVLANPELEAPRANAAGPVDARVFDVRPYLPDAPESGLYRLLRMADRLARRGVAYRVHDWSAPSDDENLARGLDTSRAVWFAFTRAGLPFAGGQDRYVTVAEMAAERSPMAEQFDRCDPKALLPGDLLVYRDDERNYEHVVMIVDALKRLAWGSVTWSRYVATAKQAARGAAFQRILTQQDWERWDRASMQLRACWRHRLLAEEARTGLGAPGRRAFGDNPCDAESCFVR